MWDGRLLGHEPESQVEGLTGSCSCCCARSPARIRQQKPRKDPHSTSKVWFLWNASDFCTVVKLKKILIETKGTQRPQCMYTYITPLWNEVVLSSTLECSTFHLQELLPITNCNWQRLKTLLKALVERSKCVYNVCHYRLDQGCGCRGRHPRGRAVIQSCNSLGSYSLAWPAPFPTLYPNQPLESLGHLAQVLICAACLFALLFHPDHASWHPVKVNSKAFFFG